MKQWKRPLGPVFKAAGRLPWHLGYAFGTAAGLCSYYSEPLSRYLVETAISVSGFTVSAMVAQSITALLGVFLLVAGLLFAVQCTVWASISLIRKARSQRQHDDLMKGAMLAAQNSRTLDELEWREFEYLIGQLFKTKGYQVQVQEGTRDRGVDILMRNKKGERLVVQCKHWRSTNVGAPTVREMAGTVMLHKADQGAIVCSGRFTRGAHKEAEQLGIHLYDGKAIRGYLRT